MNWSWLRMAPWLDTRARFVAAAPRGGSLLDLASSDGETLRHFAELRPDLRWFSVDIAGKPETYPPGCSFQRANLEQDPLPWADGSMDRITCMHLVEHLHNPELLFREIARLLKPGGRVYLDAPHERSLTLPSSRGKTTVDFAVNFWDDQTHVRFVGTPEMSRRFKENGLEVLGCGVSRNLLFAAAWPLYRFARPTRKKLTAMVHWIGWSAYCIAQRPV